MKTKILIFILLTTATVCQAQFKTQDFVNNIPSFPDSICKIKNDDKVAFLNKVYELEKEIRDQIKIAKSREKVDGSEAKASAINQMTTQYGLSEEEAQKMKSGKKMSAEEKAALANKMMMQQTNISMAEMQNLKGTSKEGKKAWAEAYGAEAMAIAEGNKGNIDPQTGKSNLDLLQQLQNLNTQVQQRKANIEAEYLKIVNDPERMILQQKITAWNNNITALTGADGGQGEKMDSISVLIVSAKKKYCEKYTPMYTNVLDMHYADLKASYNDYIRIADLTRAAVNMQPVKYDMTTSTEADYLKYINEYLSRLSEVFMYAIK
jgi:hypothetical protein